MSKDHLRFPCRRRVANRRLPTRILDALDRLGGLTGHELAIAAYGHGAVRQRRLRLIITPTLAQLSATRRALGRLRAAGAICAAGRRSRRMIYITANNAKLMARIAVALNSNDRGAICDA